jgi:hypothetical protein
VHGSRQRGQREPHHHRGGATDQGAAALRQYDVGQAEEERRRVDRQARQRALRDERRIVIEREEHVRRARRNRQCRDQRADHGPCALGDHGSRDHERRGDAHPQGQRQNEGEVGGHVLTVVPANAGTHTPRPFDFGRWELTPSATTGAGGYGSRLKAGTTPNACFHTRCIDTETFGPFLMVW